MLLYKCPRVRGTMRIGLPVLMVKDMVSRVLLQPKRRREIPPPFYHVRRYLRTLYLVRLQTGRTYINPLGGTIHNRTYALNVCLPDVIGSSMRVAHVVAEVSRFVTVKALCHNGTPPCHADICLL